MGVELAVGIFIALVGGILSFAATQTEQENNNAMNQKQLDLAQSNLKLNEDVSNKNFELSKEQFEYQKQLNDTLMQREDTAMQRQVADLKAAGLSPLMASGGASAAPLTSANAPQKDMSGINSALQNMFGAYNDIYNRRLNRQQFALQSKLQSAQTFANLLDTKNNIKRSQLENKYLESKLEWESKHGFRDLSVSNELLNILEKVIEKRSNSSIPDIIDNVLLDKNDIPNSTEILDKLKNSIGSSSNDSPVLPTPKYPTKKQYTADAAQLENERKKKWNLAMNLLETRKPTKGNLADKKYMSAVKYIYQYYADKEQFPTQNDFINGLKNDVFRKNIKKTYEFVPRKVVNE